MLSFQTWICPICCDDHATNTDRTIFCKPKDLKDIVNRIEQLKSDLRTSDLNRQSLWADSLKLVDENASLQKQVTKLKEEIEQFKRAFES